MPVTMLAVVASGMVTLGTGAVFSDSQSMDGNAFTSGTVRIDTGAATTPMAMTNMSPGTKAYKQIPVQNSGSLAVTYGMESVMVDGDGDPANNGRPTDLVLEVFTGVGSCTAGNPVWTAATPPTPLYSGAISLGVGASALRVLSPRPLPATQTEALCLVATLRSDAPNDAQGKQWDVNFVFTAQQQ